MVFSYITCSSEEEAEKLGRILLRQSAAGCVNIFPITAIYKDGGDLKKFQEYALLVKTVDGKIQEVEDVIRANHSYQIPCVATLSLHRLNREYKEWLTAKVA